ncbi:MAG: hypothetical protein ACRYFZ_10750 [Janthinobacterium lividum]
MPPSLSTSLSAPPAAIATYRTGWLLPASLLFCLLLLGRWSQPTPPVPRRGAELPKIALGNSARLVPATAFTSVP